MDGKVLGTAKLSSGAATLFTTALTPGIHTLGAVYAGDRSFAASQWVSYILVL